MKKIILSLFVLSLVTACTTPLSSSGAGIIVTNTLEGQSANNNIEIIKTGKSCQLTILGLVSSGDTSMKAAMDDDRIENVATVDRSYFGILGLFGRSCLIVKGN